MRASFREGFYGGLIVALLIGLYLIWLWRPEHQVRLHSKNLLNAIESKDWERFGSFISYDYHDQWGHDKALVLERTREVFRYLRGIRINAIDPTVETDKGNGLWEAKITVDGENNELTALIKEKINSLPGRFRLEWSRMSAKPWDWQLKRVSHPTLQIPPEFQ